MALSCPGAAQTSWPVNAERKYVAFCLARTWNQRHQIGASAKRAKPGDLEIPLLGFDAQRLWTEAYILLRKTVEKAEDIVESAANLDRSYGGVLG